ncbi:MAG: hypothetical protein V1734_05005 [Nanoarchaeota archaeon]
MLRAKKAGLRRGFIADKIGPQITIAIGGILLIPAILLYLKIKGDVVPK